MSCREGVPLIETARVTPYCALGNLLSVRLSLAGSLLLSRLSLPAFAVLSPCLRCKFTCRVELLR